MESLPDDVLLEVFKNLDADSLASVLRVFSRWADLIRSTLSLMEKFVLTIILRPDGYGLHEQIRNGRYRNLFLRIDNSDPVIAPTSACRLIAQNSETIRSVTLQDFSELYTFVSLWNFPNLTKLVLRDCSTQAEASVDLPHLKHLEVFSSINILKLIKRHRVEILSVVERKSKKLPGKDISPALNSFLATCHDLRELTLATMQCIINLNAEIIPFMLHKLAVESTSLEDENFMEFLSGQRETLKVLALDAWNGNPQLLRHVLYRMQLEALEINVNIVPYDFQIAFRNTTIKKLILREVIIDETKRLILMGRRNSFPDAPLELSPCEVLAEKLISVCVAVEEIALMGYEIEENFFPIRDFLTPLHRSLPHLKSLTLARVPEIISPIINFINLERLEIDMTKIIEDFDNLTYLMLYSPNLRVVKVNAIDSSLACEKFFNFITMRESRLEEIHIGTKNFNCGKILTSIKWENELNRPLKHVSFIGESSMTTNDMSQHELWRPSFKLSLLHDSCEFFRFSDKRCLVGRAERKRFEILRAHQRNFGKIVHVKE